MNRRQLSARIMRRKRQRFKIWLATDHYTAPPIYQTFDGYLLQDNLYSVLGGSPIIKEYRRNTWTL